MNPPTHQLGDLFAQLGLADSESGMAQFLAAHSPLPLGVALPEAPFWTAAQAAFLREALSEDSEWAEPADQLNGALRGVHTSRA